MYNYTPPRQKPSQYKGDIGQRDGGNITITILHHKSLEVPLCPLFISNFWTCPFGVRVWDSVEIDVYKLEGMHQVIDVWIYIKIQFPIFDQESEPGNDDWRTKLKAMPNIEKINIVPQASPNIWKNAQTKAKPLHEYYLWILVARNIKNIHEIRAQRNTLLMSKILKHEKYRNAEYLFLFICCTPERAQGYAFIGTIIDYN